MHAGALLKQCIHTVGLCKPVSLKHLCSRRAARQNSARAGSLPDLKMEQLLEHPRLPAYLRNTALELQAASRQTYYHPLRLPGECLQFYKVRHTVA